MTRGGMQYQKLVVFGDSLSDCGNLLRTHQASASPPSFAFWQGLYPTTAVRRLIAKAAFATVQVGADCGWTGRSTVSLPVGTSQRGGRRQSFVT
jgi:phospholipase/lecithinase/hemolysin